MRHFFRLNFLIILFTSLIATPLTACGSDDDEPSVGAEFRISASELLLKNEGGTSDISVQCATKPQVKSDADWLSIADPVTVNDKGTIYKVAVTAGVNNSEDARTATVTITSGKDSGSIKVTQSGTGFKIMDDPVSSKEFSMSGGTSTIKFSSGVDYTVTVSDSWIVVTESNENGTVALNLTVSPNTGDAREGSIEIKAGPTTAKIIVRQAAYDAQSANMGSTASEIAARIYAGINIGNTMETPDKEASWNCPVVNRDYIRGLKALGFNAVRVPCAWDSHVVDASKNTIDPEWLNRVNEVVGWIIDEDMYAIVNIHWDGGWLENRINEGYIEEIDKKQHDYWTQIATRLNGYDEHLLFAGMNEPGVNGGVGNGLDAIMKYQQTFVDAVRATGGNNSLRVLINQGPSTNIDQTVKGNYKLPTDVVADRQMVEIHMYDPSDFTIMELGTKEGNSGGWADYARYYWGSENKLAGSVRNCTWGDEAYLDGQLKKMHDSFVSKGIPVIMGEYSAMNRSASSAEMDYERFKASRAAWTGFLTKTAKNYGLVPFYWETSDDINRTDGKARNQYVIDAIMEGASAGKYPY